MKKHIILSFIILGFFQSIRAQIVQNNNVPVDFSTGAVGTSIPIYTLSSGNLTLPVFLSYSSNGLRVTDFPSETGLGWVLIAGGEITQVKRSGDDLSFWEEGKYHWEDAVALNPVALNNIYSENRNIEPDLFVFSTPYQSGQFFADRLGTYRTVNETNLKITKIPTGFKIIDDTGTKFFYEKKQTTLEYSADGTNLKTENEFYTWKLTKIESSNSTDYIDIEYNPQNQNSLAVDHYPALCHGKLLTMFKPIIHPNGFLTGFEPVETENVRTFLYPVKISTKNEELHFEYTQMPGSEYVPYSNHLSKIGDYLQNYPSAYTSSDKVLSGISLQTETGTEIKKFAFSYHAVSNNRIFLDALTVSDPQNTNSLSYGMEYYNLEVLPLVTDRDMDFWGYYNNRGLSVTDLIEYTKRFPNSSYAKYGMLKKIRYPQGYFVSFEYEPNVYTLPETGEWADNDWKNILTNAGYDSLQNLKGPGMRLFKSTVSDNTANYVTEFAYTGTDSISTGKLNYYPFLQYTYSYTNQTGHITNYTIKSKDIITLEPGTVFYEKVTSYVGGKIPTCQTCGANGSKEYFYSLNAPTVNAEYSVYPYPLKVFVQPFNGLLYREVVKDKDNKTLSEILNDFEKDTITNDSAPGLKLIPKERDEDGISDFYTGTYNMFQYYVHLNNSKSKTYNINNVNQYMEQTTNVSYIRNLQRRLYPVLISNTESNGDVMTKELFYPEDFSDEVSLKMVQRNILSPVLENISKNGNTVLSGSKTLYRFQINGTDTMIVADKTQFLEDGVYKTDKWFDLYDDDGNLLESHGIDGIYGSFIYGYDNTVTIASAVNARQNELFYTSFEEESGSGIVIGDAKTGDKSYSGAYHFNFPPLFGTYKVSYWKKVNGKWEYRELLLPWSQSGYTLENAQIDELRVHPPDAYMTTVTYKPLVGKTSETDAQGTTVYYEYDTFGRLYKVYDQDKKLLKKMQYHIYNNQ